MYQTYLTRETAAAAIGDDIQASSTFNFAGLPAAYATVRDPSIL